MSEAIAKAIVSHKNLLQSDLQEDMFLRSQAQKEENSIGSEFRFRVQISPVEQC